jgi:hypothetical protein
VANAGIARNGGRSGAYAAAMPSRIAPQEVGVRVPSSIGRKPCHHGASVVQAASGERAEADARMHLP